MRKKCPRKDFLAFLFFPGKNCFLRQLFGPNFHLFHAYFCSGNFWIFFQGEEKCFHGHNFNFVLRAGFVFSRILKFWYLAIWFSGFWVLGTKLRLLALPVMDVRAVEADFIKSQSRKINLRTARTWCQKKHQKSGLTMYENSSIYVFFHGHFYRFTGILSYFFSRA